MKKKQVQKRMTQLIVPCDKLSGHPFGIDAEFYAEMLNGEYAECREKVGKKGEEVITRYWLELAENYTDMKPLEAFHREVLFALISAYEQGFDCVTFSMTLDSLTGGKEKDRLHKEQYDAIKSAIDKLGGTRITVDLSALFEACPNYRKNYTGGKARLVGCLLPCKYIEAEVNGQKTLAVKILDESPLMTVAKAKKQVLAYDAVALSIPNQNNTERVITIKNYLLRRIELTKQRKLNKSILFDTVYTECGFAEASHSIKQNVRKIIFAALDAFKAEGIIKEYKIEREGNKYRSITIST